MLTNTRAYGIIIPERGNKKKKKKTNEIKKIFDKIMFAVVILMALVATIAVVYGLVVDFCLLGLCFIPVVLGFWAIVVLFYKCYLE